MAGFDQGGTDPNGLSVEPQNGLYPTISTAVQAVVNLYGIPDLLTWQQPAPDGTPTGVLKSDPNMTALVGVGRNVDPALWQYVSPVNHIGDNLPPVLSLHGTADDVVDRLQPLELQAALQSAGAVEQTYLIKDAVHSFALSQISNGRDIRWLVGDFFDRALKGSQQSEIVHETFTDNSFTARADPATDLPWIRASADSNLSLVTDSTIGTGKAIQDASTGDGRMLVNFSEVHLDQHGQTLVLTFDTRLPVEIPNAAEALRFGLYDNNGTMAARFDDLDAAGHYFGAGDDRGYMGSLGTGTADGSSLYREVGQAVDGVDDLILAQNGLTQLLTAGGSLADGLKHTVQLELERAGSGMLIRLILDGEDLGLAFDHTALGVFNELAFGTSGALTYRLDNVNVSTHLSLLPGDANRDGLVDSADYTIWADHYLASSPNMSGAWSEGDYTSEGIIDGADYTIWADNFAPAAFASAVPEPSTLALFGIGTLALLTSLVGRTIASHEPDWLATGQCRYPCKARVRIVDLTD
jgi:hypothetical protein